MYATYFSEGTTRKFSNTTRLHVSASHVVAFHMMIIETFDVTAFVSLLKYHT